MLLIFFFLIEIHIRKNALKESRERSVKSKIDPPFSDLATINHSRFVQRIPLEHLSGTCAPSAPQFNDWGWASRVFRCSPNLRDACRFRYPYEHRLFPSVNHPQVCICPPPPLAARGGAFCVEIYYALLGSR